MWTVICFVTAFFAFLSGYLMGKMGTAQEKAPVQVQKEEQPTVDEEQAAFERLLRYNAETAYKTDVVQNGN